MSRLRVALDNGKVVEAHVAVWILAILHVLPTEQMNAVCAIAQRENLIAGNGTPLKNGSGRIIIPQ